MKEPLRDIRFQTVPDILQAENKMDEDPGDTSVTRLLGITTEMGIMGDSAGYPPEELKKMGDSAGYPPKEPKKIV